MNVYLWGKKGTLVKYWIQNLVFERVASMHGNYVAGEIPHWMLCLSLSDYILGIVLSDTLYHLGLIWNGRAHVYLRPRLCWVLGNITVVKEESLSTRFTGYFGLHLTIFPYLKQEGLYSESRRLALECLTACGKLLPYTSKSYLVLIWDLARSDFCLIFDSKLTREKRFLMKQTTHH